MHMIFLVDGDNHLSEGLTGIDLLSPEDTVLIFYGRGQSLTPIRRQCQGTRAKVQYLESVRSGKNSIDFQIITELGVLVGRGEAEFAYVISQDKGYESAIGALRQRYANTFREVGLRPSIESCLQAAFLLRPRDQAALAESLEQTYGKTWGPLIFGHLQELFAPSAAPEPSKAETSEPQSRRKKRREAPEEAEAAPEVEILPAPSPKKRRAELSYVEEEAELPQEPELPQKKRTHRGGRRHHKR